jgi:hypothetical protein
MGKGSRVVDGSGRNGFLLLAVTAAAAAYAPLVLAAEPFGVIALTGGPASGIPDTKFISLGVPVVTRIGSGCIGSRALGFGAGAPRRM